MLPPPKKRRIELETNAVRSNGRSPELLDSDDQFQSESSEENSAPTRGHVSTQASKTVTVNGHGKKPEGPTPSKSTPNGRVKGLASTTNVFKMEAEVMLQEIRLAKGSSLNAVEEVVRKIKEIIENIPDQEPLPPAQAQRKLLKNYKVSVPIPGAGPPTNAQYKLGYSKPSHINVIGSYASQTSTRDGGKMSLDMVAVMPGALFTEKDYLDYRYFHKKAYFVACIAQAVRAALGSSFKVSFTFHNGNELQPAVLVQPAQGNDSEYAQAMCNITILPAAPEGIFPIRKTLPNRKCVRLSDGAKHSQEEISTPFYNATLRADCSMISYLKLVHTTANKAPAYRDACLLGRQWLKNHGLGSSIQQGGFGNFEWSAILALLLNGGGRGSNSLFSTSYDSVQMFSAMIHFLSTKDPTLHPMELNTQLDEKLKSTDAVPLFFDGRTGMNILYKMNEWSYKELQREARTSASFLGRSQDMFIALFKTNIEEPRSKYDFIVQLDLAESNSAHSHQNLRLGVPENVSKLLSKLSHGLGDRVDSLAIRLPTLKNWSLSSAGPPPSLQVLVGLCFQASNASRTVDRGPPAEQKEEAASFRAFWGERAELRRFKDGSILESVVWPNTGSTSSLMQEIVQYIISRHFSPKAAEQAIYLGSDFDEGLPIPLLNASPSQLSVTDAFKTLESHLRGLDGLPLQVRQILLSDYGSSSNTHFAFSNGPASVVLQFEGTGRWPDDLKALFVTKSAFLLKMAELMQTSLDGVKADVSIENEHHKFLNRCFLRVRYTSGACFNIRIYHDRELELIERQLKSDETGSSEKAEIALALAEYKRTFLRRPLHTQAMITMTTRYPTFASTVGAVTAWFGSHLLSRHFRQELIEVFVALTYLHPAPWNTPTSPLTGFLRTLHHFAQWDWQNEPLIVDFSGGMTSAEKDAIITRYDAWRKIDPLLNRVTLFVATNNDPEGSIWTEYTPSKVLVARLMSLASAACNVAAREGIECKLDGLFKPSLAPYDFTITLNEKFTSHARSKAGKQSKYKNMQIAGSSIGLSNELEAVKLYVDELQTVYAEAAVFFYNSSGGAVITGIWNPQTIRRKWKVHLGYSSQSIETISEDVLNGDYTQLDTQSDVTINKDAILAEIARLGGDLVSKIETKA